MKQGLSARCSTASSTPWRTSTAGDVDARGRILASKRRLSPRLPAGAVVLVSLLGLAAEAATLRVSPPAVHLSTARDRQALVVQVVEPDGITRDATLSATISVDDPTKARLDGRTLFPLADGDTAVTVTVADQTVSIPVHIERAGQHPDLSFRLDVMPVFMRSGCNAGSCHGSARGKDGFRLSLFGFDPAADYQRLTREQPGRRINLAVPTESLLLTKATATVPHTGGARLTAGDEHYATLQRWLEGGAADDPGPTPAVVALELHPPTAVLDGPAATQQFTVLARYADGTDRDVTSLAVFLSSNDASAKIDRDGLVTAGGRGEAFVMARFETHTVGSQVIALPENLAFAWTPPAAANRIDELVNAKLYTLRINPSAPCSDEEFLRRASIDIGGVLPTSDEYRSFLSSPDPDKRARLVDQLLERKEFVDLWVMKWSELMMVRTVPNQVSEKAMFLYYGWLQDRIEANTPIDTLVRELLAAKGGTFTNPATNYFQHERDTLKTAENVAQVFMGMRIQCAQCHNHPFDRWTMDDYYGFASFFAQVKRKPAEDPRERIVFDGGGEVPHLVTKQPVKPRFLGTATPDDFGKKSRREAMADWLTSTDNPWFPRNVSNVMWSHFFGVGITDPVDDVRISNPPANPELLAALSHKFVEYNYDMRKLVRDICTSRTYQLSSATNETNATDTRNFSRAMVRRVRAEVLLDCISQATATPNKFKGLPLGSRAVQIADGNTSTYFLTTFGRATRATVCSCEVKMEPNLSQALHLLNGDATHNRIQQGKLVPTMWEQKKTPEEIIRHLYLRTVNREPVADERSKLLAAVEEGKDATQKQQILNDIFWALLNSKEFIFNH